MLDAPHAGKHHGKTMMLHYDVQIHSFQIDVTMKTLKGLRSLKTGQRHRADQYKSEKAKVLQPVELKKRGVGSIHFSLSASR